MNKQNTFSSSLNFIVLVLINFHASSLNPINTVFSKHCFLVEENEAYSQLPLHQQPIYSIPFVLHRGFLQPCIVLPLILLTFCLPQLPSQRADHLSCPFRLVLFILIYWVLFLFLTNGKCWAHPALQQLWRPKGTAWGLGKVSVMSFWGFP